MKTKTSRSESIVCGFAIAVLVAGFAAGMFAKPDHARPHTSSYHADLVRSGITDQLICVAVASPKRAFEFECSLL